MKRNDHGFTVLEIVVVMVLISVIAVAVFSHSITTDQINFAAQVDKIRQHIRYAQSLAMKRNEIWGISCNSVKYWLFKDNTDNKIQFSGEQNVEIYLSDLGVTMNSFDIYFNKKFGVPYLSIIFSTPVEENDNPLITIGAGTQTRSLIITPQTGLIVTQ